MFAARYSSDISRDFERGYSFTGWGIQPVQSEEDCRCSEDEFPAWCDDPEDIYGLGYQPGYLPAKEGLCAFIGETEDEAIANAMKMEWVTDGELYIFPAKWVGEVESSDEEESGAARVIPLGEAQLVR